MSKAQRLSTWRNLEKFVVGDDIDPVYFDSPYFVYPDGPIALEVLRVIGAAMARLVSSGLGALPSAGASGWSWRSRAVPGPYLWR